MLKSGKAEAERSCMQGDIELLTGVHKGLLHIFRFGLTIISFAIEGVIVLNGDIMGLRSPICGTKGEAKGLKLNFPNNSYLVLTVLLVCSTFLPSLSD